MQLFVAFIYLCSFSVTGNAATLIKPDDLNLRFEGRYDVSKNKSISFDHPGFTINLNVIGTSTARVLLSAFVIIPHRFWINVDRTLSDHVIDTRNMTNNKIVEFPIATGLNSLTPHSISLVKVTEAQWNALIPAPNFLTFEGFIVDEGAKS